MKHYASSKFWKLFYLLSPDMQLLARHNYALLKNNPSHPSLHYKSVYGGKFKSVRVGIHYRAVGIPVLDGVQWFWIGSHAAYDKLLGR